MRALRPSEIRALRDRLGMSQAEFAEAFYLNVRTLQNWELGRIKPSGAAAILLWLIDRIPNQIQKALRAK